MAQSDKLYPIAETFTSLQGEGVWCGTLMHFIRLAGCNVGQYSGEGDGYLTMQPSDLPLFREKRHSVCQTALGQRFLCDTNYHRECTASATFLAQQAKQGDVEHVCITGGEPFLHDLQPLCEELAPLEIHVETSGTLEIPEWTSEGVWVTCSPKKGYQQTNTPRVDEFKFVIGSLEDEEALHDFLEWAAVPVGAPVFVQPVNNIETINKENLDRVLAIIERNPQWRLSVQLHKILGVR